MDQKETKALELVVTRLRRRFPDVAPETIEREVEELHHQYDHCRVRGYVAILVEREAREHLQHLHLAS